MLPQIDEEAVRRRMAEMENRDQAFPVLTNGRVIIPKVEEMRPPMLIGSITDW